MAEEDRAVIVVTSPDDTVEAYTKERKNIPAIKFHH